MGNFSVIVVTLVLLVSFNAAHGRRYLGCFKPTNEYEEIKLAAPFTVEKCAEACLTRRKILAVIRESECRCTSRIITSRIGLELLYGNRGSDNRCGENGSSIYVATAALVESEEEKSQSTANFPSFEGCYALDIKFDELAHSWDEENSNLRCAQRCRRDGYIISATKENFCGCSNTLPSTLYASAVDIELAAGAKSQCNVRCAGMKSDATSTCEQDECCGGPNAYTIYTTGEVNAVRQLLVNLVNELNDNGQSLLKKITKTSEGPMFSLSDWTAFNNDFGTYAKFECWNNAPMVGIYSEHNNWKEDRIFKYRCGNAIGLEAYGCEWSDFINCLDCDGPFECQPGQYISGVESFYDPSAQDRRYKYKCCSSPRVPAMTTCTFTHYFINELDQVMKFETSPPRNSFIQGFTSYHNNVHQDRQWRVCVAKVFGGANLPFSVTMRAKLNSYSNGGNGDSRNYECVLKNGARDHTCKAMPNLGLHYLKIYMKNMQRLLVHGDPTSVEPLGEFDTEYDNSHSSSDNKLTKTFQVTKTAETSFSTQAGINIGVEVSASTKVEVGAYFAKATTGFSTKTSFGESLNIGYSNTRSSAISETFSTEVVVPAGNKVLLNLFKEKYDLIVKWRANLEASGFVEIQVEGGTSIRVDVGQILSRKQRNLYAFGTLLFGDRQKITAVTAFFNGDEVVSKPPPPKPSIQFNKTMAEQEITKKYGLSA